MTTENTSQQLKFTDKIKDGRLRMTEMEIGTSVSGTLIDVDPNGNKYGPTVILELPNKSRVVLDPSGNVKRFFCDDVIKGERPKGTRVTFTRKEDKTFGQYPTTQFYVQQEGYSFKNKNKTNTKTSTDNSASLDEVKSALKG